MPTRTRGRPCTVCQHPNRDQVDRDLVDGLALDDIVAKYSGIRRDAVNRHKLNHLPATLVQSQQAVEVASADGLLAKMANLEAEARRLQAEAEKQKDIKTALAAVRELVRMVVLQARILGELRDGPTVNVLVTSPEWLTIRGILMDVLKDYPDAADAVAAALMRSNVEPVARLGAGA